MWFKGFNIRDNDTFVTDGPDETYSVGEPYPVTRNGVTFGWSTDVTASCFDRNAGADRRLAGCYLDSNGIIYFRVDLPSPGVYRVGLASGDFDNPLPGSIVRIGDSAQIVATVSGSPVAGEFLDALSRKFASTQWPLSQAGTRIVFSTTQARFYVGQGASAGLAHVYLNQGFERPFATTIRSFRR